MLFDLPSNPLSFCTAELQETVSSLVESLNDLFKKRAEALSKPPETLVVNKETKYDSTILSLFSEFVHNQLSLAKTYSDKQRDFVFDVVTALLLSSSEEDGLLAMCFWDLFSLIVSYLLPSSNSGKMVEERVVQILSKMAGECNAKEMFLLIMESFENIKDKSVQVHLIKILVLVVPRLQVEKLKTFMKTSFPHLLHTVYFAPVSGNSQETKEFARDMTVEFHGQDPNNYKAEVDTSSISLFMPHLIEYIKYFVSVLSKHPFHNQVDESNDVSQQQHMVLSFLLRLLDSLAHCPLDEFKEMATNIMDLILKLGVSVQFLFENKAESWEKRQKQEEEEEEEQEEEVENKEYFLSGLGLACYFYMTFVKSVHLSEFPSIISPSFKLKQSVPFMTFLLLNPPAANKGLDMLEYFTSTTAKASIQAENVVETFFFSLSQSLVHFMVNCPIDTVRSRAFTIMNNYISLFDDETRFYLLKNIVINCQYTSVAGLMTTRIKQEAELAWPKENEKPTSLFVSEKIREVFPFLVTTKNLLDRVDVVMSLLNLYRFLIIRDKQTNYTGVWKDSELKYMKERFIDKLVKKTQVYIEKLQKTPDKKEQKQQEAMMNMYNLPKMSDQETQAYNQMTTLTLTLMQDTANRVLEVIRGKPLFTGVPTVPPKQQNTM